MEELNENMEAMQSGDAPEEPVITVEEVMADTPAAAEEPAEAAESMDQYSKELDSSMRQINVGDILTGTVVGISDTEVTVDLQYYAQGIVRPSDFSQDPSFSISESVHVGDEVTAKVLRMDDGHGNILLSVREASEDLAWERFRQMMDDKTVTVVKVAEAVKGGVVAFIDGVRGFIPASRLALSYVEDLTTFKGKELPVRIITAEKDGKRLVMSAREALREQRDAEKANMVSNMQVGLVTEGTVESIQPYGAFVGLGNGIDGLVHISQITSERRLKNPSEVLSVGDKVKVKITQIKDGKISLTMKALEEREAAPIEEERVEIPKSESLTTSLGSLLKGLKFDN